MINMKLNYMLVKNNINQKYLSDKLNISKNTIGKYCNNTFTMINKEHLDLICEYFNCSISDLIEFTPNNKELNLCLEDILTDLDNNNTRDVNIIKKQYYEFINKNIGNLTIDQIQKYAMMLSQEPDTILSYTDIVALVTQVNNHNKKRT